MVWFTGKKWVAVYGDNVSYAGGMVLQYVELCSPRVYVGLFYVLQFHPAVYSQAV